MAWTIVSFRVNRYPLSTSRRIESRTPAELKDAEPDAETPNMVAVASINWDVFASVTEPDREGHPAQASVMLPIPIRVPEMTPPSDGLRSSVPLTLMPTKVTLASRLRVADASAAMLIVAIPLRPASRKPLIRRSKFLVYGPRADAIVAAGVEDTEERKSSTSARLAGIRRSKGEREGEGTGLGVPSWGPNWSSSPLTLALVLQERGTMFTTSF